MGVFAFLDGLPFIGVQRNHEVVGHACDGWAFALWYFLAAVTVGAQ
jgi:hypothetical protein